MPNLEISPYPDTASARGELVAFLEQQVKPSGGHDWKERMRFWWDENPAAMENKERGRWVHAQGRLVAYGGSIPALHTWEGRICQAVYATTFCVDEQFPRAAALVFLQQREVTGRHEVAGQCMIAHTTPNPRIQTALFKLGARAEQKVTRHFFAAGAPSHLHGRSWWPALPRDKRLVADPNEVTAVARGYQCADRIEKWITPEYLRWFCRSPMREHHFLGVVDGNGTLSSYLLVTPGKVRGLRCWDVVESFTTEEDETELHALTGELVKQPDLLPGGALIVTGATFPADHCWDHRPAVMRREQKVCHFFLVSEALGQVPKHTVMAEGDLGL